MAKKVLVWALGIAAAIVLAVIGLLILGPDVDLHAKVRKSALILYVKNVEMDDWADCVAWVNDGKFQSSRFSVAAGNEAQVPLISFATDDGTRFNSLAYKVVGTVKVQCGPEGNQRIAVSGLNSRRYRPGRERGRIGNTISASSYA